MHCFLMNDCIVTLINRWHARTGGDCCFGITITQGSKKLINILLDASSFTFAFANTMATVEVRHAPHPTDFGPPACPLDRVRRCSGTPTTPT
jgi:hypothetical protein